ncbi:delta-class carbonic anhydrase [Rheinheimera sp.]|uniref:delta-class carbonic anhydrase n=1 Tax=Rheinheimera sp. TaxID=1869214 RepID=UPI00307CE22D
MSPSLSCYLALAALSCGAASANDTPSHPSMVVPDQVISAQNAKLAANSLGKGFGPQSPRDLDAKAGNTMRIFALAPPTSQMNLCNIHLHRSAEHKGGEFTRYAGNGDGKGIGTGYHYSGTLSAAELKPLAEPVCAGEHGSLQSGDTIEVHYVHSSAMVGPGATLNACFNDSIKNPELRVEAQVYVLVNDSQALDFAHLAAVGLNQGYHQAPNIPTNTGTPIQYAGSTTGPAYNEVASPFQVTWSVRPKVAKVNVASMAAWCKANPFHEHGPHAVRNLVVNPELLSVIP